MKPKNKKLPIILGSTLLAATPFAHAVSGDWDLNSNGNWSTASNWSTDPTAPGTSAGDVISLTNDISGDTVTVTIDTTSRTAGILNIGDEDYTNRFTLNASGGAFLTLDNDGNGAEINETGFQVDTVSTPITLADNLAASVGGVLRITGDISQSGGAKTITKTGAGELILTGANSYSGTTHLYSGRLSIQNNTALGTTAGNTIVAPGAQVNVIAPLTALAEKFNIAGAGVGGNGALRIGGGGTTNMTGAVTLGGNATIGTDGDPLTLNMTGGIITAGHAVTFVMNGAACNINTFGISGAGFVVMNGGMVVFNVANSYSGGTTVSNGTLTLGTATNALGATTGTLTVNGGTLNMASYNLTVGNLTGTGGTISGTASGNRMLTMGQGDTGGGNFYGTIANGSSGTTSLTKVGTGVITLSGSTNSYTGATLVNAGTLRVNGSTSSSSPVTVASGATLAGSGFVRGTVAVNGNVAPGNGVSPIGTLNVGSTTWNGGTNLFQFNLASTGSKSDRLAITGAFTKGSGSTFHFDFMGSTPTYGTTFTLATFSSQSGFVVGDFTFTGLTGQDYTGSGFTLNPTSLQFTAIPEASNLLVGGLLSLGLVSRRRKQA